MGQKCQRPRIDLICIICRYWKNIWYRRLISQKANIIMIQGKEHQRSNDKKTNKKIIRAPYQSKIRLPIFEARTYQLFNKPRDLKFMEWNFPEA